MFKIKDYIRFQGIDIKLNIDWKNFMKLGFEIKNNWINISMNKLNVIENFNDDCLAICNEIYTNLKGKSSKNRFLNFILLFCIIYLFDYIFQFLLFINFIEHTSLPKLRKENIYVESDLNTSHQQFMYDFVYDSQDIYDYYDPIFEEKNNSLGNVTINIREPHKPFASALQMIDYILMDFTEEKDMQNFANLRWYIIQASFESTSK